MDKKVGRVPVSLLFLCVSFLFLINSCTDITVKKVLIQDAVQNELASHPQATLIDLYKLFFLGAFGPGHMIKDRQSAVDYLNRELQAATEFDSLPWQAAGYNKQYYRINLRLVKEGLICKDSLIEAFVQSANSAQPPSIESWKKEWQLIIGVIEEMDFNVAGFERDKKKIAEMLKNNQYVAHHSQTYLETYHPHYRIVNKKYFERLVSGLPKNH